MPWPFRFWKPEEQNLPYQSPYDPQTGGFFYRFRDLNSSYTHVWAPSIEAWAAAIGKGVVDAQQAARPVGLMPDVSRIRHDKQPVPK